MNAQTDEPATERLDRLVDSLLDELLAKENPIKTSYEKILTVFAEMRQEEQKRGTTDG